MSMLIFKKWFWDLEDQRQMPQKLLLHKAHVDFSSRQTTQSSAKQGGRKRKKKEAGSSLMKIARTLQTEGNLEEIFSFSYYFKCPFEN